MVRRGGDVTESHEIERVDGGQNMEADGGEQSGKPHRSQARSQGERARYRTTRAPKVKIVDDLYADSLGKPGSEADTVDKMLVTNAGKIAAALK